MSCAKAFCCSCGVGAPPDPDDVVVVVVESVAGVLVVAVVDVVVLVVVEDAEDEEAVAEDGWPVGLKIRPGPTCGIPIVLQTFYCHCNSYKLISYLHVPPQCDLLASWVL